LGDDLDKNETLVSIDGIGMEYSEFGHSSFPYVGVRRYIKAIEDISLEVFNGENIALLGRNGAGKSTLLRLIMGFLRPSRGTLITRGRVVLLAGTNPGFLPFLTGRKNLEVLAPAYGITPEQMGEFIADIEDFTGLEDALDRNFSGYSTGMKGKLGFGFITGITPDVLLIDETLGVGDIEFRAKAQERLKMFIERSGTVILSTHSLGLAKEMCSRGIVLDGGSIIFDGPSEDAVIAYSNSINNLD
tara:strand:+ start:250 stop:984 length:735 start_codon:yes stop_codon:yes gene_type:complete